MFIAATTKFRVGEAGRSAFIRAFKITLSALGIAVDSGNSRVTGVPERRRTNGFLPPVTMRTAVEPGSAVWPAMMRLPAALGRHHDRRSRQQPSSAISRGRYLRAGQSTQTTLVGARDTPTFLSRSRRQRRVHWAKRTATRGGPWRGDRRWTRPGTSMSRMDRRNGDSARTSPRVTFTTISLDMFVAHDSGGSLHKARPRAGHRAAQRSRSTAAAASRRWSLRPPSLRARVSKQCSVDPAARPTPSMRKQQQRIAAWARSATGAIAAWPSLPAHPGTSITGYFFDFGTR